MLPNAHLLRWQYCQFWIMAILSTEWHKHSPKKNLTQFIIQPSVLLLMHPFTLITVTYINWAGPPFIPGDSIIGFSSYTRQSWARHLSICHLFFMPFITPIIQDQVIWLNLVPLLLLLLLDVMPSALQQYMTGTYYKYPETYISDTNLHL